MVPSWNPASHPGINEASCTAAIGLRASQSLNRVQSRYTGKERDTESGLDYFGARYYSSNMGRWMSPDWADKPEAVPYSSLDNPQSLNLYGYVLNNPRSHADADGHCCDPLDVVNFAIGALNAFSSDHLAGLGRVDQPTGAGQLGARFGDGAAAAAGVAEVVLGTGGNVGGLALDATGVGAVAGVPINVASTALTVEGAATATTAVVAMGKGSYTNTHESGMTYDGKGGSDRAANLERRLRRKPVISTYQLITHHPLVTAKASR